MFKAVIIEDDSFSREMLNDMLVKHSNKYVVTAFFDSVKSSVRSLHSLTPDLVFLDMELTDGKGFEVLEKIPEINFEVIVTTQHDSFLMQAIKHSALDYILKPVKKDELELALKKFEKKSRDANATLKNNLPPQHGKIILAMNTELLFLNIDEIIRLESDGAYTTFYTKDKKKFLTSRTLATYEPQLLSHGFFRIHHSHLINLNFVEKYQKGEGGYVIMSDKSSVDVSRRKKDDFMKALGQ
jgi:two-component system LytT family response regulator